MNLKSDFDANKINQKTQNPQTKTIICSRHLDRDIGLNSGWIHFESIRRLLRLSRVTSLCVASITADCPTTQRHINTESNRES